MPALHEYIPGHLSFVNILTNYCLYCTSRLNCCQALSGVRTISVWCLVSPFAHEIRRGSMLSGRSAYDTVSHGLLAAIQSVQRGPDMVGPQADKEHSHKANPGLGCCPKAQQGQREIVAKHHLPSCSLRASLPDWVGRAKNPPPGAIAQQRQSASLNVRPGSPGMLQRARARSCYLL